ncbi:ABC transporter permease [Helicovermis profundi]|uniref:Transport permease protein n=1 Tax=Helicovermis profundi TaxID=3065157 RepID=A0AAU9E4T0_9FIRM|nr:ABC transporter permease [Clostridia bacterium S502]
MSDFTVIWREWIFFKRRFFKITSAQIVTPILYLITFGWGLNTSTNIDGNSYMYYILPGIAALTTMRSSYSGVSMRISVARLHEKSFENYFLAPISVRRLAIEYIISGALRGIYACFLMVIIMFIAGAHIEKPIVFILATILNATLFSAIGFFAAMIIDTHYDMNRFTSFVITPMSFLCGTFFSVSKLPIFFRWFIELLPLTHATRLMRSATFGRNIDWFSFIVLITYIIIITIFSIRICYEESRI